jgi:hypothetical protein
MNYGRPSPLILVLTSVLVTLATSRTLAATDFYVAPNGTTSTAAGTGSLSTPWRLQTALSHPSAVKPGDTIWLRAGTYTGRVSSALTGASAAPIKVRPYPGERARLDGGPGPLLATLTVGGQYTWYWGFEIFSSEPNRRSAQDGSWPTDLNRGSCVATAQDVAHVGIRLINLVLHDGTDAIGSFQSHQDGEIYGNLIFNNGWNGATDRGHGNGLYVQNQTGTKKVSDNIIFNQYGGGMQIYGSANAYLDNIQVTGNTIFSSGWPSAYGCDRNFLFGGGRVATNGTIASNYLYYPDSSGVCTSGGSDIGYEAGVSNFTVQNNWFANGDGGISSYFFGAITGLTMTGNHFLQVISGDIAPASYPSNTYHGTTKPTGTFAYVRPNAYEPGRANITIYNWDRRRTVSVDVSSVLATGQAFEVRNVQDFFAPPVLTGTYASGSITLPMTGLTVAAPIGGTAPPPTGSEFNVFVLLPLAGAPSCSYTLGTTSASAGASGGTASVPVTAGAGCSWTATSGASWLTITGGASGTANGTVSYSVAANASCAGRSGTLTIAGQAYTVTQAAGSGVASISPTAATTSAGAGGGIITVTVGAGCAWTSSSNAPWITVSGTGTGGGTATYTIASNSGCARSGSLTVAGQTFTVSQAVGGSCVVTGSGFYPITPCRVLDTRNPTGALGGPSVAVNAQRVFPVTSSGCGIPAFAKSVATTVTVVRPAASGALHAYPGDLSPTSASVLSFRPSRTRSASALLLLATNGTGTLGFQNESTGATDLILDVTGYFR